MNNPKFFTKILLQVVFLLILLISENCNSPFKGKTNSRINYVNSLTVAVFNEHADLGGLINYEKELPDLLEQLKINSNDLLIEIDKSDYILSLNNSKGIIKQYPVVFGQNPYDDKLMEGDCCTPEGSFKVLALYGHDKWSRFIWFNYPNEVSMKKHNDAKQAGLIPQDARPGGEVGIHGVPQGYDFAINIKWNWTAGCISLKNRDIDEVYEVVKVGTQIFIHK